MTEYFKQCGEVSEVRVTFDDDGTNKGFAYVQFENAASAAKALALENPTIDKYTIRVAQYKQKKKKESKGFDAVTCSS